MVLIILIGITLFKQKQMSNYCKLCYEGIYRKVNIEPFHHVDGSKYLTITLTVYI